LYRRSGEQGYYFSPADLELVSLIPDLAGAGVNSFKIEGRMKSAEYVGTVVSAYRRVLDGLGTGGEQSIREAEAILKNDFAREKTRYFFFGGDRNTDDDADLAASPVFPAPVLPDPGWLRAGQDGGTGIALGTLLRVRGSGEDRQGLVHARPVFPVPGDSLRIHRADDSVRKTFKLKTADLEHGAVGSSSGDTGGLWISVPEGFAVGDSVYLIQTRQTGKRYPRLIDDAAAAACRRVPGRDKAPAVVIERPNKKALSFPEGTYVAVSRIEDLYALQSVRPLRVMLPLNRAAASRLLAEGKPPLPFNAGEIVLRLDPWFPQSAESFFRETIPRLRALGYHQFEVNNLGHFALFRDTAPKPAALIAGPFLYTFNRWALSFVLSLGSVAFITPLENNRQNPERTVDTGCRSLAIVTVFSRPALFRVRASLEKHYGFGLFEDSRGEQFRLLDDEGGGSRVLPVKPFSIVDKRPFLEEAGFRRFIVDLSGPPVKKKDYKSIMTALYNAAPLPGITRFNWKNGFYAME
jgi:putative protease